MFKSMLCVAHVYAFMSHGFRSIYAISSLTGVHPVEIVYLCGAIVILGGIVGPAVCEAAVRFTGINLPDVDLVDGSDDDEEEDQEELTVNILRDEEFVRLMHKSRTECAAA